MHREQDWKDWERDRRCLLVVVVAYREEKNFHKPAALAAPREAVGANGRRNSFLVV